MTRPSPSASQAQLSGTGADGAPVLSVLAKRRYRWAGSTLVDPVDVPLLREPIPSDDDPELLLADMDAYAFKPSTDVVVVGSAHPPRVCTSFEVSVRIGASHKRVLVVGRRRILRSGSFSDPEPVEPTPLSYQNAFGGSDAAHLAREGHPLESLRDLLDESAAMLESNPYTYPRNPCGKGFAVTPSTQPTDDVAGELPLFEDTDDRLSPPAIEVPSFMRAPKREAPPVATAAAAPFSQPVTAQARPAEPFTASTAPLDLEHLRNMLFRGPTPFRGETTPERLAEIKAEAASANEDVGGAVPSADETAMYMPSAEERKRLMTLPFKPAEASAADKPSASTEIVRPPGEAPGADETAMLVPSDAMRAAISALPFASEKAPGAALTVEGYAALAAELQAHGATAEVLAKFQIAGLDRLREVHAEQERRFAADPSRRAYFEMLRAIMAQTLREQRR